jgi:Na+-translocating ferredoxin:NAD+ oxidoreductase subunit G
MSETRLPMAGGDASPGVESGTGASTGGPPPPPARPRASSPRLVATLAVAGAVAGFFIVLVYQWSQPRIEAHQARVLAAAVEEVLDGPSSTRTFFMVDGRFTDSPAAAVDTTAVDRIYVGYDEAGAPVGVALAGAKPGFQDVIRVLFGYDPAGGRVLGMKVLESKETPGLGDKIEKDEGFVGEFRGVTTPLEGVKEARRTDAPNEIVMITGATISSQAIVDIINQRLESLGGTLDDLWAGGVSASRVPDPLQPPGGAP